MDLLFLYSLCVQWSQFRYPFCNLIWCVFLTFEIQFFIFHHFLLTYLDHSSFGSKIRSSCVCNYIPFGTIICFLLYWKTFNRLLLGICRLLIRIKLDGITKWTAKNFHFDDCSCSNTNVLSWLRYYSFRFGSIYKGNNPIQLIYNIFFNDDLAFA